MKVVHYRATGGGAGARQVVLAALVSLTCAAATLGGQTDLSNNKQMHMLTFILILLYLSPRIFKFALGWEIVAEWDGLLQT